MMSRNKQNCIKKLIDMDFEENDAITLCNEFGNHEVKTDSLNTTNREKRERNKSLCKMLNYVIRHNNLQDIIPKYNDICGCFDEIGYSEDSIDLKERADSILESKVNQILEYLKNIMNKLQYKIPIERQL